MVIVGEFRGIRFEIRQDGGEPCFTRFELLPNHLCRCTRNLVVASVLGKPLCTLGMDALAFALGPGYEAFPEHVRGLLAKAQPEGAGQIGRRLQAGEGRP